MIDIEQLTVEEYRPGVSPGAAARQLCRSLGVYGGAPTLKRLIEDMLDDANRSSHDRNLILSHFADVDPGAAAVAKHDSFLRSNPHLNEPDQNWKRP
jgi:hypothetical protein